MISEDDLDFLEEHAGLDRVSGEFKNEDAFHIIRVGHYYRAWIFTRKLGWRRSDSDSIEGAIRTLVEAVKYELSEKAQRKFRM